MTISYLQPQFAMIPPRFHPFARLLLCLLLLIFSATLSIVGLAIIFAILSAVTGKPLNAVSTLNNNPLIATLLVYPGAFLSIWLCRRAFDRQSLASLGLRSPGASAGFFSGALCGTLAMTFLFGILFVCGYVRVLGWAPEVSTAGLTSTLALLLFHALVFFSVGFMEEVSFRGYGLHNLTSWGGLRFGLILQAIVFALVHLYNVPMKQDGAEMTVRAFEQWPAAMWDARWAMVNIALIGFFFGLCYLKTGSLWFPIGFHAAWNFCLGCLFSLPVSNIKVFHILDVAVANNHLATGGDFGAEGSLFLVAMIGALLLMLRSLPHHPQALSDLALLRPTLAPKELAALSSTQNATESAAPAEAVAVEEFTPPRFKTSMRPNVNRAQLDLNKADDLFAAVAISSAEKSSSFATENQTIQAAPSLQVDVSQTWNADKPEIATPQEMAPVDVEPIETTAPTQTKPAHIEILPRETTVVQQKQPEPQPVEYSKELVEVVSTPKQNEPAATSPAPAVKPKKPAPKW